VEGEVSDREYCDRFVKQGPKFREKERSWVCECGWRRWRRWGQVGEWGVRVTRKCLGLCEPSPDIR